MSQYFAQSHFGPHGLRTYVIFSSVSGRMNQHMSEVLYVNAYAMWDEQDQHAAIKSRRFEGVIHSNLQVIQHWGTPVVEFQAIITDQKWGADEIKFIVRVDDLQLPPDVAMGTFTTLEDEYAPAPPMDMIPINPEDLDDGPEFDTGEPTYG